MEGRGVTNYDTDKPSYAFSTSTTEFDDALMQRDIVTLEQAMMAKGASSSEAQRLANLKRYGGLEVNSDRETVNRGKIEKESDDESDNDGSSSEDDDDFLQQYRQRRLQEIKQERRARYGQVIPISRDEWTRHVSEASEDTWVVVTLVSSDVERTGCVERAAIQLARKFGNVKFVSIPSQQAIHDWPDEHLPTVFLYRDGKLKHQMIRLPVELTADQLEWKLAEYGVVETGQTKAPVATSSAASRGAGIRGYHGSSAFGGTGALLATRHADNEEGGDY